MSNANKDREPDLTGIYFESGWPVNRESWLDWLSQSCPGFYDPNAEYVLDEERTREPFCYVITKRQRGEGPARMKIFIVNNVAYQAPSVQKVGFGRLNSACYYLQQATEKLAAKKRKTEEIEKAKDDAGKLMDPVLLRTLDTILATK